MFKPRISKEEVNRLPMVLFDGQITLVENTTMVESAVEKLFECDLVGVDTETRPSFSRGTYHRVALLQISTREHCYLFRLNKIGLHPKLAAFLASDKVKKIGLALRDDFSGLGKLYPFKPQNFIDLQTIVAQYGILELGLQKIFAIVFGRKISKSQRLTNWESDTLNEQQMRYAATDAWASLMIYLQLLKEKKISKKEYNKLLADDAALRTSQNEKSQNEVS